MLKILGYILLTTHVPTGATYDVKHKDGLSNLYVNAEACYEAKVEAQKNLQHDYSLFCLPVSKNTNL